jgi:hypothetical protein
MLFPLIMAFEMRLEPEPGEAAFQLFGRGR